MSNLITDKDWIMISAYLDKALSTAEIETVEIRLEKDPSFKKALDEISYIRRMLHSLPQKRAPRNFTLSPVKTKAPIRFPWMQPALKYVSIAAAVMTVMIFVSPFLLFGMPSAASQYYDSKALTMERSSEETGISETPAIINWNPMLGMGGGGGTSDDSATYAGGIGGGPVSTEPGVEEKSTAIETEVPALAATPSPEEEVPSMAAALPTEEVSSLAAPQVTGEESAQEENAGDLSTLILGLPEPEYRGMVVETDQAAKVVSDEVFPLRMILVFISGGIALLCGIFTLILRKR